MSASVRPPQVAENADSTTIYYPESDGKPMAESDLHRDIMFHIIHLLQRFFSGQQVYVSGNLLIYYEEGNPYRSVAPDCFIVRDVDVHLRKTYKIWEEGKGPEVVFEVTSSSTQNADLGKKMRLYAQLGVQEYYLYDPTADYLDPSLRGFRLNGNGFVPMSPIGVEEEANGVRGPEPMAAPEYISQVLGLRITLDDANGIQFYDVASGQRVLSAEEARKLAEEKTAEIEAENERLRAELARLRGE